MYQVKGILCLLVAKEANGDKFRFYEPSWERKKKRERSRERARGGERGVVIKKVSKRAVRDEG